MPQRVFWNPSPSLSFESEAAGALGSGRGASSCGAGGGGRRRVGVRSGAAAHAPATKNAKQSIVTSRVLIHSLPPRTVVDFRGGAQVPSRKFGSPPRGRRWVTAARARR